jgi:hypothetical protein
VNPRSQFSQKPQSILKALRATLLTFWPPATAIWRDALYLPERSKLPQADRIVDHVAERAGPELQNFDTAGDRPCG